MKNQILIKHPKRAYYPKDMILMEKNILANILSHETGQKFILPIFQAFFPQIKNSDQLLFDRTLTKNPAGDHVLGAFDGIIAYTKKGEYYILNVHSPLQGASPKEASFEVLKRYRSELIRTEKVVTGADTNFYYLGLLPSMEFNELPYGANARYRIGKKDKNGQDRTIETLHIHLEAMKNREMTSFGHITPDTKWAFMLSTFGDLACYIPEEKEKKYLRDFFETVCIQCNPDDIKIAQESKKKKTKEQDYIYFSDELLDEIGLFGIIKEAERNNPTR